MHNRFHADLRQYTGAIFRFLDGTLPREREAIAESVTGSSRLITHDGYRMAACAAAAVRRRAAAPPHGHFRRPGQGKEERGRVLD